MDIQAKGNNIILNKINVEEQTKAGIIVHSNNLTPIYEIVSIGEEAEKEDLFKIGDKVIIRNTVGSDLIVDPTTVYKSVRWWEIEGIVEV